MLQKTFAFQAAEKIKGTPDVLGLAAGGSWIYDELDEYSDLDLILVSSYIISDSKDRMLRIADKMGDLLSAFTGEHVGDPRVLICMYDNPLLHVDIKFLSLDEFKTRVEDPVILWEKDKMLSAVLSHTGSKWPKLNFQYIEDRFWTWIHYGTMKIGRGELFETIDFLSYLRSRVIAPLMQLKNGQLPRALRKVEFNFKEEHINDLKETIPHYDLDSILSSLDKTIHLYVELRSELFPDNIKLQKKVEEKAMEYLKKTKLRLSEQ